MDKHAVLANIEAAAQDIGADITTLADNQDIESYEEEDLRYGVFKILEALRDMDY